MKKKLPSKIKITTNSGMVLLYHLKNLIILDKGDKIKTVELI